MMECLGSLELFLHDESVKLPLLVQLGLVHAQFETIHPFFDGNGRLGRLLITVLLCARGALKEPLLYLSLYFKTNRNRYYELLQKVRTEGAWEEWLEFFLEGTESTARQAADAAVELVRLFAEDRQRIETLGRSTPSALRVHEYMQKKPLMNIGAAAKSLELSIPTVAGALQNLAELGIVRETTGRQRGRVFVYQRYLQIVTAGTEPIKP
jgi:Fic family protein